MNLGMAEDHKKKTKLKGFHRDSIRLGKQWYLYHLLLGSNFVITAVYSCWMELVFKKLVYKK